MGRQSIVQAAEETLRVFKDDPSWRNRSVETAMFCLTMATEQLDGGLSDETVVDLEKACSILFSTLESGPVRLTLIKLVSLLKTETIRRGENERKLRALLDKHLDEETL